MMGERGERMELALIALIALVAIVGIFALMVLMLNNRSEAGGLLIRKTDDGYMILSLPPTYKAVGQG